MHRAGAGWQVTGVQRSLDGRGFRGRLTGLAWAVLIAGTASAAFAVYGLLSRKILNPDQFVFGIAAKRLLVGERLYADFFEAKPPLATLVYAIPGAIWPGSYLAVCWLLAVLLVLQGLLWLWWFRPTLATAAACFWFVVLYPASFWDFGWMSTEHLSNVFITIDLLVAVAIFQDRRLVWWRCFLAGAAAIAAFHCRQNAVLGVLVPLAVVLLAGETPRAKLQAVAWLAAGGALAWAVVLGVVWLVSNPQSYFFQVFVFPQRFAQAGGRGARFHLLAEMSDKSLPALMGLAAGLALTGPDRRLAWIVVPTGLLLCLSTPAVHYHYWVNLFPFLAMCLLLGLPRCHPRTPHLERVVLAVVAASVFVGMLWVIRLPLRPSETGPKDEVAGWIDSHARPSDTLYVFGPMGAEYIQFRSKLLPANKYTISWELDDNNGMMADSFDDILRSYLRHPPTIFVIHDDQMSAMKEARSQDPVQVRRSTRLAVGLMNTYPYEQVKELNGFHIYVLYGAQGRWQSAVEGTSLSDSTAQSPLDWQKALGQVIP